MSKYISYGIIRENDILKRAKVGELKHFIREGNVLDEKIAEVLPLSNLGNPDELLAVDGSNNLIKLFQRIDEKKYDFTESIENIKYNGMSKDGEIILEFKNDNIIATGIYEFTYDFFEVLFNMGKYQRFCMKNELDDLLQENINKLFDKFKETVKQFRFIEKEDNIYLRAITSKRYKNYDNNLAIYISLFFLNKLSIEKDIKIKIESAYISDSTMRVFFEQEEGRHIDGVGDIYFGILLTNGEIRNSEFSMEIYYKIVDDKNKELSFTAIPNLSDCIFSASHTNGIDSLINKVNKLNNIITIEDSMLSYIESIKKIDKVSENILYSLMLKITKSRIFSVETKDNFQEIYDKRLIDNSMSLLQVLGKINNITVDIDERIYLQRIYDEIIKEISRRN